MRLRSLSFIACSLLFALSACSGPREVREVPREEVPELPTPAVQLSEFETFNPTPYEVTPPAGGPEVKHDVPGRLMEGRADEGVTRTVQGFRVQIYSSLEKDNAVQAEEQAKVWWRAQLQSGAAPDGLFGSDLPVVVRYLQPYYRVRIGDFATRQQAERARAFVERRFPGAFIVPDTVTITR